MINLKYLVMYLSFHITHTRRHIAFLIIFLYPLVSLATQNTSDTATSIIIDTQEVRVPVHAGLRITLKGQDWMYTKVNAHTRATDTTSYLSSIEDTESHTIFLFYKENQGAELFHFNRYDNEMDVLYSYDLRVEWREDNVQYASSIYSDDFIQVALAPPVQAEDHVQSSAQEALPAVETKKPYVENQVEQVEAKSDGDTIATSQDVSATLDTGASEETDGPVPTIVATEDTIENTQVVPADEDIVISTSIPFSTEMSKNEIIEFISAQIDLMPFEELKQVIERWSNAGTHHVIDVAHVIWYFAQKAHDNVATLKDITNLLELYNIIIEKYPLSKEYFLAVQKAREIREHYIFVLE